ncbi:M15 family metallopeptidase [Neobacillus mesonae]|uniref:M15 family metallopeptidase n=1 Tax=Neobacillus mesonae TaxID=1193713 RepID=UPI002E2319E5|nr:M15 family metallopeptidase [Neobacillus mesonae]
MKRKKIVSSVYLLALLLFIILFFIKEFGLFTDSNINSAVPLPANLHPVVEERSQKLIQQAAKKGIVIVITDGFRSAEEQNRLYEKGRTAGGDVVTYAKGGESYHNFGLAVDFALKTQSGNVIWDMQYDGNQNGKADWAEVVQMAKTLGFEWGGDWAQFKDYPHLQMDFGLTIAELQQGERPPGDSSLVADTN